MKFQVEHQIAWQYDRPVFIEPMTVRLRPRSDGSLHLHDWQLNIDSPPSGQCHALDALGNTVTHAWFHEMRDGLQLQATSSVETLRDNPFDYLLIHDDLQRLPFVYEPALRSWLLPYLARVSLDARIDQWASELSRRNGLVQPFLSDLVSVMFADFERNTREEGAAFTPATTYDSHAGTCRDLAVLFIDVCRSLGIAARFVSGYAFEPGREGSSDLHAWVEVFLPGAGWRAYDPTLGVAVTDQHIPLVAAPEPLEAAPTSGTFRGTEAQSTMEFHVRIETVAAF